MGRLEIDVGNVGNVAPLLDTHAWLWWMTRDARLGRATLAKLDALPVDNRPYISDISLWEVAMLTERRRLALTEPLAEWLESAAHPRTVRIAPISQSIVLELVALGPSAVRDPADRIIIATSRALSLPLLTRDAAIRRSGLAHRLF